MLFVNMLRWLGNNMMENEDEIQLRVWCSHHHASILMFIEIIERERERERDRENER